MSQVLDRNEVKSHYEKVCTKYRLITSIHDCHTTNIYTIYKLSISEDSDVRYFYAPISLFPIIWLSIYRYLSICLPYCMSLKLSIHLLTDTFLFFPEHREQSKPTYLWTLWGRWIHWQASFCEVWNKVHWVMLRFHSGKVRGLPKAKQDYSCHRGWGP